MTLIRKKYSEAQIIKETIKIRRARLESSILRIHDLSQANTASRASRRITCFKTHQGIQVTSDLLGYVPDWRGSPLAISTHRTKRDSGSMPSLHIAYFRVIFPGTKTQQKVLLHFATSMAEIRREYDELESCPWLVGIQPSSALDDCLPRGPPGRTVPVLLTGTRGPALTLDWSLVRILTNLLHIVT